MQETPIEEKKWLKQETSTEDKKSLRRGTFYSFQCCLTGVLMQDPLMDTDGNSYERKVVEKSIHCRC